MKTSFRFSNKIARKALPQLLLYLMLAGIQILSLNAQPAQAYCSGLLDNYLCPEEPVSPDPALLNMLTAQQAANPCYGLLEFDNFPGQAKCNGDSIPQKAFFIHQLVFPVGSGNISAATFQFRAKAAPSGQTSTDFISFFEGSVFITGANLSQLVEAGGTWDPNQDASFTLDLGNLPPVFSQSNILQYLNDGDLDVLIGNETGVDWMCINLPAISCCTDQEAFLMAAANVQTNAILSNCSISANGTGLNDCMQITWDWGDGSPLDGPHSNNNPVSHTYTGSPAPPYLVCYTVNELDEAGNICWEAVFCIDEEVQCDSCACGAFTDLNWRPSQGAPSMFINCGDSLTVGCLPVGYEMVFSGSFNCTGENCPPSLVNWVLREAVTQIFVGSGTLTGPAFNLALPAAYFANPGVYELFLIGECDGELCEPCMFTITSLGCDCMCGMFENIKLVNKKLGTNQMLSCNNQLAVGLTCPPAGKPYKITGKLNCMPASCIGTQLHWELINSVTGMMITSGNQPGPWFSITLDNNVLAGINGLYDLVLTGMCGNDVCTCVLHFDIAGCPNPPNCPCDEMFAAQVAAGFSYAYNFEMGTCELSFTPNALTECDKVDWEIQGQGISFNASGTTTFNQAYVVTIPTGTIGNYKICMKVERLGTPCKLDFCQTITINCLVTPICSINGLENPGFDVNSTPGILSVSGSTEGWSRQAGMPELLEDEGCNDPFAIQLIGKCWPIDIDVIDHDILILPNTGFHLSACYKAADEDLRPGTQLVFRLSDNQLSSTECTDGCLEVARLPIDTSTGDTWRTVSSSFYLAEIEGDKFLTIHLENDLAYDDPDASSSILLDNICFEQNDSTFLTAVGERNFIRPNIRIYPNPTSETISIYFDSLRPKVDQLQIIDLWGRVVQTEVLTSGIQQHSFSLLTLPAGVYFVKVMEGGIPVWVEKVVKQ